jgi:hypothetical protein
MHPAGCHRCLKVAAKAGTGSPNVPVQARPESQAKQVQQPRRENQVRENQVQENQAQENQV